MHQNHRVESNKLRKFSLQSLAQWTKVHGKMGLEGLTMGKSQVGESLEKLPMVVGEKATEVIFVLLLPSSGFAGGIIGKNVQKCFTLIKFSFPHPPKKLTQLN